MNIVELETKKSTYRVCIGDDDELEMMLNIIYDNEKYDTFIRIENVLTGVFPMIKFKERCDALMLTATLNKRKKGRK